MRYQHIIQQLDEVRMAPSNLKQFANSPEAEGIMAGFEAEVIFRGANDNSSSYEESEPDYDADERTRGIASVLSFFEGNGEYNSRRDLIDLEESLQSDFYEWVAEKSSEHFMDNAESIVKDWVEENDWDWDEHITEALADAGYSSEEIEAALAANDAITRARRTYDNEKLAAARKEHLDAYATYVKGKELADEKLDKRVNEIIEDQPQEYYDIQEEAREQYEESEADDEEWLNDAGFTHMSDISNNYAIDWPIWTYGGDDEGGEFSEEAAQQIASTFGKIIPAEHMIEVTSWAGKDKDPDTWYFESDSSIEPDDGTDLAIEIVSPPMPLKECLEMLDRFFKWVKQNGGYTNESTGFHMGVSMPEQDTSKVDFTKLALFLGDKYVLDEFGRMGNTYCKSALEKIESRVKSGNIDPKRALDALRSGLNEIASKILASSEGFGKFTTINPKEKYIEFRSAGGEDYSENIEKLQNTLGRYALAMHIASDPSAQRDEYQKKMYKLLSISEDSTDTIKELSKLSAGKATDKNIQSWYANMKSVLRRSQAARTSSAEKDAAQAQQAGRARYRIRNLTTGEALVSGGTFLNSAEAIEWAKANRPDLFGSSDNIEAIRGQGQQSVVSEPQNFPAAGLPSQTDVENRLAWGDQTGDANWEIVDNRNQTSVFKLIANTATEAQRKFNQWLEIAGLPSGTRDYGLRRLGSRPPVETEPQNFPAAGNTFSGQWKIVSGATGEVLYTFGGIGNSQSDANRVARDWAERTGFDDTIEVYPIMR
jgi:Putative amidoligase enzyme